MIRIRRSSDTDSRPATDEPEPEIWTGFEFWSLDDEPDTRQLLVQTLTHYGATVVTVEIRRRSAIRKLQDKNPDVPVSDIGTPDEDGYSFIKKIRALEDENHSSIAAVALTAFTRAQTG